MKGWAVLLVLVLALAAVALGDSHNDDHDDDDHRDDDHHDDDDHDDDDHHDDHDQDDNHDDDDHHDFSEDYRDIDHRLDKLTARLEHIRDRIHQRTNPHMIQRARSLRSRVQKLEGTDCGDRHFQCGGTDPECQSYLFICDGHKDCRNGADEAFCELPTKKGDYFEGHIIWDTCTQRKPDVLGFEITDVKTYDFFTPIVKVLAHVVVEYETDLYDGQDSLITVGTYHFGKHILALDPPEEDRLGLYCAFDGFNMDRCEGYIAHEASTEICAEIVFVRKHDEHRYEQPVNHHYDEYDDHDDHDQDHIPYRDHYQDRDDHYRRRYEH